MRAVVQRVRSAEVAVDAQVIAEIGAGLLVLVGVTHSDEPADAERLARKVAGLRILRDGDRDDQAADRLAAPVLVVSQFTLYADTSGGRRPSWQAAASAEVAQPLVEAFVTSLRTHGLPVQTGRFGAMMALSSVNDGPMTILLDS
jgi:D-tyrosyl-tRNA(Tyr) deacylase